MKFRVLAFALLATPAFAGLSDDKIKEKIRQVDLDVLSGHYVKVLNRYGCSYSLDNYDEKVAFSREVNEIIFDLVDLPDEYHETKVARGIGAERQDEVYFRLEKQGVVRFNAATKEISLTSC